MVLNALGRVYHCRLLQPYRLNCTGKQMAVIGIKQWLGEGNACAWELVTVLVTAEWTGSCCSGLAWRGRNVMRNSWAGRRAVGEENGNDRPDPSCIPTYSAASYCLPASLRSASPWSLSACLIDEASSRHRLLGVAEAVQSGISINLPRISDLATVASRSPRCLLTSPINSPLSRDCPAPRIGCLAIRISSTVAFSKKGNNIHCDTFHFRLT